MPRKNRRKKRKQQNDTPALSKKEKRKARKQTRKKKKSNKRARRMRHLRETNAPGRGVTKEDRLLVFAYYGRACLKCGSTDNPVLDHVKALARGGRHDPDNLQTLCATCNQLKGLVTRDYRPFPFYY